MLMLFSIVEMFQNRQTFTHWKILPSPNIVLTIVYFHETTVGMSLNSIKHMLKTRYLLVSVGVDCFSFRNKFRNFYERPRKTFSFANSHRGNLFPRTGKYSCQRFWFCFVSLGSAGLTNTSAIKVHTHSLFLFNWVENRR